MRLLFFLFISFFLSFDLAFAEDERYTIEVNVDVTDVNASAAREKAMNKANRAAISAVARRLSTEEGAAKIADMTDAQLVNFVKETSVSDEKTSDVRYMANLRVVVNDALLKEYMLERDIPLQDRNEPTLLIVPLFREFSDDAPLLWEIDNPWKKAWQKASETGEIGKNLLPIQSSVAVTEALSASQAEAVDVPALEKVMNLQGATDAYVLDAVYDGVEGLEVKASSWSGIRRTFKVSGAKSSGDLLFHQAVLDIAQELQSSVSQGVSEEVSSSSEITILYLFETLGDWVTAEQKIKEIPIVSEMQVQAMAQGRAQFQLLYNGSEDILLRSLKAKGYELEEADQYKLLKKIGE